MENENVGKVIGQLVAVKKEWRDKTTGEVREYMAYQVDIDGAIIRFVPMQYDRSLLRYMMGE